MCRECHSNFSIVCTQNTAEIIVFRTHVSIAFAALFSFVYAHLFHCVVSHAPHTHGVDCCLDNIVFKCTDRAQARRMQALQGSAGVNESSRATSHRMLGAR